MRLTDFHSAYYAHELTKRCASDSIEKLAGALVNAQVDLNPHQVEAALFAFRSPLSRGALLADEVGLGKTADRLERIVRPSTPALRKSASYPNPRLVAELDRQQAAERQKISQRNGRLFEEEASKLDGWAEDLKVGLEREIKDYDRQLREARRAASASLTLEEKLDGQRQVKKLESERNDKRRKLFVAQDEIEQRRDKLIEDVQGKLEQKITLERILSIRWRIN